MHISAPKYNVVFILAAPYIAEDFLINFLKNNPKYSFTFHITSKGLNENFLEKLKSIINSPIIKINIYESFELSDIKLKFFEIIRLIANDTDNVKRFDECFIQSLEPFLSRYLLTKIQKTNPFLKVHGLCLSLPVFLFRDNHFIASKIKNEKLRNLLLCHNLERVACSKVIIKYKEKILKITEYLFDYIFINKNIRKNRLISASSYVPKNLVHSHITQSKYFAFCLEALYDEPVNIVHKPVTKNNFPKKNNRKVKRLIILGPVN